MKLIVALVLLIAVALVTVRIYVGRFDPTSTMGETEISAEDQVATNALQVRLNLPKSLIGEDLTDLTADLNNLFSKALGGDHKDIEVSLLKWKTKFFLVSSRGKKTLDALEGPFWGEDQGWFVGCEDKPGKSPIRLENSVAFAGWEGQQRKILKAWRVDKGTGRFTPMLDSDTNNIDCTKIPGWIEDFEDSEEGAG